MVIHQIPLISKMLVFQVENIFGCLKTPSMLLTWKDPTIKWVPRCISLVFAGFMNSLMINVVLFLGCTSKNKFESFPTLIMIWIKQLLTLFEDVS